MLAANLVRDCMRKWCAAVDVHDAPGTHMTLMLDPHQSECFAPRFEATLEPGRSWYAQVENGSKCHG
jgi:hypothetical protein